MLVSGTYNGGFKHFLFSPLIGEDFQFDDHIFQMGWFNHLPVTQGLIWLRYWSWPWPPWLAGSTWPPGDAHVGHARFGQSAHAQRAPAGHAEYQYARFGKATCLEASVLRRLWRLNATKTLF